MNLYFVIHTVTYMSYNLVINKIIKKKNNKYDANCIICFKLNKNPINYYKCTILHNICIDCYENNITINANSERSNKCPLCSASLKTEHKEPEQLSVQELQEINVNNITSNRIYIHQNFTLQKDTELFTVIVNNKPKILLHALNGRIITYLNMFICHDGFMYVYNIKDKCYQVAITKNKYQFWDKKKIVLKS